MNRIAAGKDPPIVDTPSALGVTAVATQPPTDAIAPDEEDAQAAVGDRYGLHGNQQPLAQGLVSVLQPELRTNFGRTEREAERNRAIVDLLASGSRGEAEFRDGHDHQLDLQGLLGERHLLENVARPFTDLEVASHDGLDKLLDSLMATELDGAPRRKGLGLELRKAAQNIEHAAQEIRALRDSVGIGRGTADLSEEVEEFVTETDTELCCGRRLHGLSPCDVTRPCGLRHE